MMKEIYSWGIFLNFIALLAIITSASPLEYFFTMGAITAFAVHVWIVFKQVKKNISKNKYQTEEFRLCGQIKIMDEQYNFEFDVPGLLFDKKPDEQDYVKAINEIIEFWLLSKTTVTWDLLKKSNEENTNEQGPTG